MEYDDEYDDFLAACHYSDYSDYSDSFFQKGENISFVKPLVFCRNSIITVYYITLFESRIGLK